MKSVSDCLCSHILEESVILVMSEPTGQESMTEVTIE